MGFPSYYGRNMNAWIDFMTYVDEPGDIADDVVVADGDVLTLEFRSVDDFAARCREQYEAVIECAAFVNYRRIELGDRPILALSFWRKAPT
jgi:hypothetical protein